MQATQKGENHMRVALTDAEMEREIAELEHSPLVKLARKNNRLKYMRRQRLYTLRSLQKQGERLQKEGVTLEDLEDQARMMRLAYESFESEEDPDEVF